MLRVIPALALGVALLAQAQGRPIVVRDIDGRDWALFAPARGEANLLLFVTADCPISNRYAPEIGRIATEYGPKGVRTFLIYADPALDAARVRTHVAAFHAGVSLPAFVDRAFSLTAIAGIKVTPEVALYTPAGRAYRGRIDDLYIAIGQSRREPTRRDLRLSLDAVLAGRPAPVAETPAVGCFIERKMS